MNKAALRGAGGFTLIEVVAATAVFFIIMVLLAQMTKDMAALVQRSNKGMDGDAQARQIFSLMARDLAGMPHRLDMDYSLFKHGGYTLSERYGENAIATNKMPGNDSLAFVSSDSGHVEGGKSAMSLIVWKIGAYQNFNGPVLQRLRLPLAWESDASPPNGAIYLPKTILSRWPDILTGTYDYEVVGDVFRIEYQYWLRADSVHSAGLYTTPHRLGTSADAPLRQVGALVVTLAVLDSESRKICGSLEALTQTLPDAADGENTAEIWNKVIQTPGFAPLAQMPDAAASSIRVYQRFLTIATLE